MEDLGEPNLSENQVPENHVVQKMCRTFSNLITALKMTTIFDVYRVPHFQTHTSIVTELFQVIPTPTVGSPTINHHIPSE